MTRDISPINIPEKPSVVCQCVLIKREDLCSKDWLEYHWNFVNIGIIFLPTTAILFYVSRSFLPWYGDILKFSLIYVLLLVFLGWHIVSLNSINDHVIFKRYSIYPGT